MRFFTDPSGFTHRARFYGIPCYYKEDGTEGCALAGTNVIFDWMILHFCPWVHYVCEQVAYLILGADYEPSGWRIELRGALKK